MNTDSEHNCVVIIFTETVLHDAQNRNLINKTI